MSEKKTILINPDLFKVQSKQTRKKRPKLDMAEGEGNDEIPRLRIKTENSKSNRTTKNQVLKYIRQQQEKRYKQLMEQSLGSEHRSSPSQPNTNVPAYKSDINDFQTDFQQSLDYLNSLAEKNRQSLTASPVSQTMAPIPAHPFHNQTIKQHSHLSNHSALPIHSQINYTPLPNIASGISVPAQSNAMYLRTHASPQYGCMKNGSLPTYRMWKQQTQKNYPTIAEGVREPFSHPVSTAIMPNSAPLTTPPAIPMSTMSSGVQPVASNSPTAGHVPHEWQEQKEKWNKLMTKFQSPDWLKKKQEIREHQRIKERAQEIQSKPKFVRRKLRKTARRTFRLGRSKYYPRVAVLVSNRTIRKQISDQCQKLKQTPIEEVRKTLIKKGFIKVGSIAPNDVLRKMYESVSTVCGDVQNHNSENLVYNYFHDKPHP